MFDFLFGRKKDAARTAPPAHPESQPAAAAPAHTAPGTRIAYSPELVDELRNDHQALLKIFTAIGESHAAGNLGETSTLLEKFRSVLAGHLLKENVRLYIYLERALSGDAGSHALVRQYRHEMDGIGKAVLAFLDRYRNIASDPVLTTTFGADLSAVGKVLVERIRNEEDTLYSLYLPAY